MDDMGTRPPDLAAVRVAWGCWSAMWALIWAWLAVEARPRPFCAWYQVTGSPGCRQWSSSGSAAGMAIFLTLAGVSALIIAAPVHKLLAGPLTRD